MTKPRNSTAKAPKTPRRPLAPAEAPAPVAAWEVMKSRLAVIRAALCVKDGMQYAMVSTDRHPRYASAQLSICGTVVTIDPNDTPMDLVFDGNHYVSKDGRTMLVMGCEPVAIPGGLLCLMRPR